MKKYTVGFYLNSLLTNNSRGAFQVTKEIFLASSNNSQVDLHLILTKTKELGVGNHDLWFTLNANNFNNIEELQEKLNQNKSFINYIQNTDKFTHQIFKNNEEPYAIDLFISTLKTRYTLINNIRQSKYGVVFIFLRKFLIKILKKRIKMNDSNLYQNEIIPSDIKLSTLHEFDFILDLNWFHCRYEWPTFELFDKNIKHYFFVYDLIPLCLPQLTHSSASPYNFLKACNLSFNFSSTFVFLSKQTEDIFLSIFNNRIINGYLKVDPFMSNKLSSATEIENKHDTVLLNKRNVLFFSGEEYYKNLDLVLASIAKFIMNNNMCFSLNIIGKVSRSNQYRISKLVQDVRFKNKLEINLLSNQSDDQINKLLNNTDFLIYPSLIEGYGIPPRMAISNNIPVISLSIDGVDIFQDNLIYLINPYSIDSLVEAIKKIVFSESLSYQKNLGVAKKINWNFIVEEIINHYACENFQ